MVSFGGARAARARGVSRRPDRSAARDRHVRRGPDACRASRRHSASSSRIRSRPAQPPARRGCARTRTTPRSPSGSPHGMRRYNVAHFRRSAQARADARVAPDEEPARALHGANRRRVSRRDRDQPAPHLRRHGWDEALHTLLHEMVHQWQDETGYPIDHGRDVPREGARGRDRAVRATSPLATRRGDAADGLRRPLRPRARVP